MSDVLDKLKRLRRDAVVKPTSEVAGLAIVEIETLRAERDRLR
jgi:hypothetical protein